MTKDDLIGLEIKVLAGDATEDELDKMTRNLLTELRGVDVESAVLVSPGDAPEGTKGDPITIGTIALKFCPSPCPDSSPSSKRGSHAGRDAP
ncbi:MAG: hypothetical protein HND47_10310 [Chloroflexi bacterium]|nr:hypothetical protein [Chloroflexota bacterium]